MNERMKESGKKGCMSDYRTKYEARPYPDERRRGVYASMFAITTAE
jgi:hypothetical protein